MKLGKITFAVMALSALGVMSGTQESAAATTKLKDAEIVEAIAGKTFKYNGSSSGELTYTDTTFAGKDYKHGSFDGTWQAKGNKYCFTNSFGSSRCAVVRTKGNGVLKFDGKTFKPQ